MVSLLMGGFMLYWGAGIEWLDYVYWVIRPLLSVLCGLLRYISLHITSYHFIHTTVTFGCSPFKEALSVTSKHIHQPWHHQAECQLLRVVREACQHPLTILAVVHLQLSEEYEAVSVILPFSISTSIRA